MKRKFDPSIKADRHELYRALLEIAPNRIFPYFGEPSLCFLIWKLYRGSVRFAPSMRELPELLAQRPANYKAYWWRPWRWGPRIKALKRAIEASRPIQYSEPRR